MPALDEVVLRREHAPQRRTHAQHRKVIPRDELRRDQLRPPVEREAGGYAVAAEHSAEDLVAFADVLVHRVGDGVRPRVAAVVRPAAVEQHQFLRVLDWQQLENDLVDEGEDGGVGADAEGERKQGHRREERRLAERTNSVAEVLPKGCH